MAKESCADIYALPEDCIAYALSLTSPKDACRLSVVASTFRSAAESDAVWERFLPPDYWNIISRSIGGGDSLLAKFQSKKELYLYLCDHPILIDAGKKSFSLDKWSGKKCYMLGARDLYIVWAETDQYWQWISLPESRFPEVAELLNVCWLEIRGNIPLNMLSCGTNYTAYLVFTFKSRFYGFDYQNAEATVGISGQEGEISNVCLDPDGEQRQRYQIVPRRMGFFHQQLAQVFRQRNNNASSEPHTEYSRKRSDGWMEVKLGEYFVNGVHNGDLAISLMEVKGGNWKSGLIVHGIEIRPKDCK